MNNRNSKISYLINRAIFLFPDRFHIELDKIKNIEKILGVTFSTDFKNISMQFSFEIFSNFYSFDDDETDGVIPATLQLRKTIGFPKDSLILYEDDASVIILKTTNNPSEPSPVFWIDITDVERYSMGEPLESPRQIFPSFTDFFEYLVTEEEKEREEEKGKHGA